LKGSCEPIFTQVPPTALPQLINPSAVKSVQHNKLKNKWAEEWEASKTQEAALIDGTTLLKEFLKTICHTELT